MHPQLETQLSALRLSGLQQSLEVRLSAAQQAKWTHAELLLRIFNDELEHRQQRALNSRIRRATIAPGKTLDQFDFTFNPRINRDIINELATCRFVEQKLPVVITGPTGTGKTHLAQALVNRACMLGHSALYTTATALFASLALAEVEHDYRRKLKKLARVSLLVIDDFGLRRLRDDDPEHFYDVINARYEIASTIITSNRILDEWPDLFGDPLLASSGLDRLFHRATVIDITGPSFRAKDRHPAHSKPAKPSKS
jgi:DNA replication protein DnaC